MSDQEIDELKELVRQNIKLSQDTNRLVRQMRRASRLKSLFWFLIFCLSIGSSIYTYFYFIEPRLNQVKSVYQQNVGMVESAKNTINKFLNMGSGTSTLP